MPFRYSLKLIPERPLLGVLAAAIISVTTAACVADRSEDYRFEVVDQPVAVGAHSEFNVKLTKASTGEPVENATITESRLEMIMIHPPHKSAMPGRMSSEMGGEAKVLGSPSPGVYRVMGDVSMPGKWDIDLVATVPGEPQPIQGTATFKAGE